MRFSPSMLWSVVALFAVSMAAVVLVVLFGPGDELATVVVANIAAALPATIAVIANIVRTNDVAHSVGQVQTDTNRLVNGLMDSKVRSGVADVLKDELIDEDVHDQLIRDRAKVIDHGGHASNTENNG